MFGRTSRITIPVVDRVWDDGYDQRIGKNSVSTWLASARTPLTFYRRSLRWRICWLLVVTAVVTVTAFGFFAYRTARATTLTATYTRLSSALAQINTLAELGTQNQLEAVRAAAGDRSIIDALQHSAQPLPDGAATILRRLQGGANGSVELRLSNGAVRYASDPAAPSDVRPFAVVTDAVVGPMYESGGAEAFDIDATVTSAGAPVGGIRVTRRLGKVANRRLTASLLGNNAALLIGNRDGTLWSDAGAVSYPLNDGSPIEYVRNGTRWVSAWAAVKDTPWLYAVEIPEHEALAPARALLMPFVITGALIALAGVIAGLRVSRKITDPLEDLTGATEAIARGERNVTLTAIDRPDEIGRLARAFASMATSVRAVRDQLESDIDVRTGELTDAVGKLRELDEELRRNERFATIGRLSGSVGHELRNPLGVMSTIVFLLDALPDASPKLKDYAGLLREQIRLSERIISDLLDRAKTSAPVHAVVDVPRLLDEVIARAGIPESVRVEVRAGAAMPLVALDRDHVGQIIWNLVNNAVQAIHGSGTIRVDALLSPGRLRIEVRDSGPGVAPADRERVFEPLFTTKLQGVGLGLSVSRAFARSNGGDLFVIHGGDTAGACFVLDLPVRLASVSEAAAHNAARDRRSASAS
jgi:signal transduction histidine kinase